MKQRCYNETHIAYKHYGGRGITVYDEWLHSFEVFRADLGDRPLEQSNNQRKGV